MKRFVSLLIIYCISVTPFLAQDDYRDDQEGDAYPDIVYVPIEAFRENRDVNEEDATEIGTAIFRYCLRDIETARARNWNVIRQNPDLNFKGTRYFITYSYHFNPDTGICSVTLEVFSGPEYDPKSTQSLGTFHGSSQLGYSNQNGNEVSTQSDCLFHAGSVAAKELCGSELFTPGWETRPFPE